jgi:hypothetical protein
MNQENIRFTTVGESPKKDNNANLPYLVEISANLERIIKIGNIMKDDEIIYLSKIILISIHDKILFSKYKYCN